MSSFKNTLKSIAHVAFSRGVSLLSSVAVGLLLPKILSVDGYGFFKIYTLYVTYTSLLHFGFADGILLRFAGRDYDSLDRPQIRGFTRFFLLFQFAISAVMSVSGVFIPDSDYSFIVTMLGINMMIINLTTYYQFLSQATQRFAEYSARNFFAAVLKIVFVLVLFFGERFGWFEVPYQLYVIVLNVIDGLLLLWYIFTYRDITFGAGARIASLKSEILSVFKQGIVLTIAYQVSHLILALDRQFVSVLFPTETYAYYSFAYNLVTMISTMISSLAVVLLPMLKKATKDFVSKHFSTVMTAVAVLVGAAAICFFPLVAFIGWFLPEYVGSVGYLKIVLPSLMYNGCISVVMFTFCKVLDENFAFFRNGCIVLAVGFVSNATAYMLFKTPESISYASIITMAIWFLIEGRHIGKKVGTSVMKPFLYLTLLVCGFLAATLFISSVWLGALAYIAFYLALTLVMYGGFIRKKLGMYSRK